MNTPLALRHGQTGPAWHLLADHGASYTVRMPLETWLALPPHPRQRDARKQGKTIVGFARAATGPQAERLRWVVAADLDGEVFKADGHARSFLWESGALPRPPEVFATVYRCRDRDELNALYASFDAASAAETMYDRVCGAYHEHGLQLTSKRLRYGSIVDALHLAMRGTPRAADAADLNVYAAVKVFREELQLLDSLDPQPEIFLTGLVAASLISLAIEPQTVSFFARISAGQGGKREGLNDPVETILLKAQAIQKANTTRQRIMHVELCGAALLAATVWGMGSEAPGFWNMEMPDPTHLREYVVECVNAMRERKGIASERTL